MMKQRIITALAGIPILVAAVWFDAPLPWFTVLIALLGMLAALEFYRLVKARVPPLTYLGMAWASLFILSREPRLLAFLTPHSDLFAAMAPRFDFNLLTPLLFTSAIVVSLFRLIAWKSKEQAFNSWAWTMAGILYTGWLLSYFVALRGTADGRNWVLLALFATFASDTAAFLVGRTLGRHRLAPAISPAKTWEGAIAGVFGAVVVSLLFTLPSPLQLSLSFVQAIVLGILVSIFGQLGDLVESLFKRNMGVKDSGRTIPGHGGLLDRMDSVVFAGVVVYYYV
ncbi:MAG: phosphatidate cytidylyltransferase, partial [Chloroflexi bacterium]|nr:phosphatidate cytidylyltransferase [Chloroflexota bacterium]